MRKVEKNLRLEPQNYALAGSLILPLGGEYQLVKIVAKCIFVLELYSVSRMPLIR